MKIKYKTNWLKIYIVVQTFHGIFKNEADEKIYDGIKNSLENDFDQLLCLHTHYYKQSNVSVIKQYNVLKFKCQSM